MKLLKRIKYALSIVLGLIVVAAVLGLSRRPVARYFAAPPSLPEAIADVDAGRLEEAEAVLIRYLALHPDNRDANLIMARVELDRQNPKMDAALACLAKVKGQDPRLRATVLTLRGKALYMQNRFAEAEACWNEALILHQSVAEAGWLTMQLYYLQGRDAESRKLALKLSPVETDPVDRVRYLLELVREEVERLAAAGVIQWLEPVVKLNPKDAHSVRALGEALAKQGRGDEGIALLRRLLDENPIDVESWVALLDGLSNSGEIDALAKELDRIPIAFATDLRFAVYRGRVAQERGEVAEAITSYELALAVRPYDSKLLYRLGRAYRLAKRSDDAKKIEQTEAMLAENYKSLQEFLKEAREDRSFGLTPHPAFYQRIAELRERSGKRDEALAWHKQVIRDDPANLVSARAAARLSVEISNASDPTVLEHHQ